MKTEAEVRREFLDEFRALLKKWNASIDMGEGVMVVYVPGRYVGWTQTAAAVTIGIGEYFMHDSVLDEEL